MMNPEILATRLGEYGTNYLCLGLIILNQKNNNKGCTSGTCDYLVGTHQKVILQGSLESI